MSTPPGAWNASKTVTSWPAWPARPPPSARPARSRRWPPLARVPGRRWRSSRCYRPSRRRSARGADGDRIGPSCRGRRAPRTASPAGRRGQSRTGRALSSSSDSAAARMSPRWTCWRKRGMLTLTGHPAMHRDSAWGTGCSARPRDGQLLGETQVHLVEVRNPDIGRLLWHLLALDGHPLAVGEHNWTRGWSIYALLDRVVDHGRCFLIVLAHRATACCAASAQLCFSSAACSKSRYVPRRSPSSPKSTS